jgi:hypothetical protein
LLRELDAAAAREQRTREAQVRVAIERYLAAVSLDAPCPAAPEDDDLTDIQVRIPAEKLELVDALAGHGGGRARGEAGRFRARELTARELHIIDAIRRTVSADESTES